MKIFSARYLLPIGAPLIEDGALLVAGERIAAVGPFRELAAAHPGAAVVDCGETVLLPPLVNAHTHLELTDFPQWAQTAGEGAEPEAFVDWVLRLVRVRRGIAAAAVQASLAHGLEQSLAAGTGAVGDILTTLDAVAPYAATPLAGRVFAEVLGLDPAQVTSRLAAIAGRLPRPPGADLSWGLSPHAPYTLGAATLVLATAFAREHGLALAMHWAETAAEVAFLTRGEGPIAERLYPAAGWPLPPPAPGGCGGQSPAILPRGALLIHGVHLRAADIAAAAAAGQPVVLCPRSNSRFGAERAPLAALHRAGVALALGTDSRASCPSLSVWDELAFARRWFAGVLDPHAWLAIATAGGAFALGLAGRCGRLAPGLDASFQVVATPAGATPATLAEALCGAGPELAVQALYLRGAKVLPLPPALL